MIDDVLKLMDQGGWVMGPILIACAAAWGTIVYEWLSLSGCASREGRLAADAIARLERGERVQFDAASGRRGNVVIAALGAVLAAPSLDRDAFAARVGPLLRSEAALRRRPLGIVAMLASAMPLLGLLGTVLGMTHTFSAFTTRGAPQVDALAGGISQALITTEAGLVAAVPVLLMHGVLAGRVRRYLDDAEIKVKRIECLVCRDT